MTRPRLVLVAIVVLAVLAAWLIRWATDDAYISFTYARSLVRGEGLTWFGTHVEGYTNFLWVLWIAAGMVAGIDPLIWAWIGSLAALALAIVATHEIARLRGGSAATALCAAGLLATSFTFLAFGTSGLETMLQTALLAAATWQVERLRAPTPRGLVVLSVVCALAIATRLDSAVIVVVLAVAVARRLRGARQWAAAIAPAAIMLGVWLGWKLAYYGAILPNTFHAKVGFSVHAATHGAAFVGAFLHAYLLWPVLLGVVALAVVRRRFSQWLPAAIVIAWFAYVIAVGGDFMEFRFFVPVLPMLFVIIADAATTPAPRLPDPRLRAIATVAALGALSWRHGATFDGFSPDKSYDSVRLMATFYGMLPDEDWERPGRVLHDALAGTDATLACNGAGAIPYFADLPTVDQLGLNDAWVAEHGVRPREAYARPGHQRFAPYEYLVERKVTFVIGSPTLVRRGTLSRRHLERETRLWLVLFLGPALQHVPSLVVIAAPVDDRDAMLLWYLTPTPEITARIRAAGWEMRELGPQ